MKKVINTLVIVAVFAVALYVLWTYYITNPGAIW